MPVSTTYIAVIILLLILVGFVLTVIRTLTKTAATTIRHDMNRLLSSYDFLIVNKLDEIKKLDESIKNKQINILENKKQIKVEKKQDNTKENHIGASIFIKNEVNYRNSSLADGYELIKGAFADCEDSLNNDFEKIKKERSNSNYLCSIRKMYELLDDELVYDLCLNSNQDQYNFFKNYIHNQNDQNILDEYMKIKNEFCIIEFRDWLKIQMLEFRDQIEIRSARENEENTVHEPSICEGYQILIGNKLYDYSISKRDIQ